MRYLTLLVLIALIAVTGCDVFDQDPQTAIDEEIAIRDEKSAEAALNGLYSQLQSGDYYGSNFLIIGDVLTDISQSVGTWDFYREMDTYVTSAGNLEVRNLWSQTYATINHANNIIADLPDVEDIDPNVRDNILGQAYFIRALAYFDVTRTFGGVPGVAGTMGVPLVTEPSRAVTEESFPARASLEDSYGQIESDLLEAETLLAGADFNPNRASEASAKALLSRLYLYLEDFEQAESYATDVIDNYSFELVDDFAAIFLDENTEEAIFELAFNSTDDNAIRFWYFPSSGGGRGDIALNDQFVEMIQDRPEDERGDLIAFDDNVGVFYPTKYQKSGGDDNIQILRLAEVYLNRAEAHTRKDNPDLDSARDDLNEIRNRAGLDDISEAETSTTDDMIEAIEMERGIEFIEEGHRWHDLVRTGRALDVLVDIDRTNGDPVTLSEPGRRVLPIPSRDIDANENLEQNEAYQ